MKYDYFSHFPFAELRSQDGMSSFKICSYNYAYPQADNVDDGDWHRNYITLTIPAFKAEIDEVIFEGRLINFFLQELRSFSALQKKK
ncbi:hypothetical protein [Cytobacillus oceanisediminis]|uniref:hypothetical protein n=1 Tax=Cytobacillus oceanisediminis TaxID=665099 RepID=UPI0037353978